MIIFPGNDLSVVRPHNEKFDPIPWWKGRGIPVRLFRYHQSVGDAAVGNKGVQYSSAPLAGGIQVTTPNYGGASDRDKFHRQYTGLYRSPVPIKLQFLLGLMASAMALTVGLAWDSVARPCQAVASKKPRRSGLPESKTLGTTGRTDFF